MDPKVQVDHFHLHQYMPLPTTFVLFWRIFQTEDFDSTVVLTTTEGLLPPMFSDHHQKYQSGLVCCLDYWLNSSRNRNKFAIFWIGGGVVQPPLVALWWFNNWGPLWVTVLRPLGLSFGGAMVGIVCCTRLLFPSQRLV